MRYRAISYHLEYNYVTQISKEVSSLHDIALEKH